MKCEHLFVLKLDFQVISHEGEYRHARTHCICPPRLLSFICIFFCHSNSTFVSPLSPLCPLSASDYIIKEKSVLLQKKDSEGFGFVLRGAKGKKIWNKTSCPAVMLIDLHHMLHVLLCALLTLPLPQYFVLVCLQLRLLSRSSLQPQPSPPCSTWSQWTREEWPGELVWGWGISWSRYGRDSPMHHQDEMKAL